MTVNLIIGRIKPTYVIMVTVVNCRNEVLVYFNYELFR